MKTPRPTTLDCGCKCDATRWLEWCAQHRAEHDEIHARANAERQVEQFEPLDPESAYANSHGDVVGPGTVWPT